MEWRTVSVGRRGLRAIHPSIHPSSESTNPTNQASKQATNQPRFFLPFYLYVYTHAYIYIYMYAHMITSMCTILVALRSIELPQVLQPHRVHCGQARLAGGATSLARDFGRIFSLLDCFQGREQAITMFLGDFKTHHYSR